MFLLCKKNETKTTKPFLKLYLPFFMIYIFDVLLVMPLPLCVTLFLYLLGDWVEGSKWTDVITNAKIRTSGSSEPILSATHVKKT